MFNLIKVRATTFLSLATSLSLVVCGLQVQAQNLVIKDAMIFDGTGSIPYASSVLIEDGRIVKIAENIKKPKNAKVIDAKGMALLPGLIDIHTHWTPSGEPQTFPDIATSYVTHGVTTVNDFHGAPETYLPKREWLKSMITPHVNYAARISTPGGHGAVWGDKHTTRWISTPADARLTIKELRPFQPDIIKIFADGWRYGNTVENTSMNEDAMTALASAAHEQQLPVMAHIVTVARAKVAARAGVDVIVHALQNAIVDNELINQMKTNDIIYSPSLAVYEPKPEKLVGISAEKLAWVQKRQAYSLYNLRTFRDAGIRIALGSDAGMEATPHGESSLRELELLVAGGLTPAEALVAGTLHSAQAIGIEDDRGTVTVGKRADLILVKGQPWQKINEIRNVNTVFIDGKIVAEKAQLSGKQPAPVPSAQKALRLIDDFENANGRSSLDTQRVENRDSGVGRTVSLSQRILRENNNHALLLTAVMSTKESREASVIIPFTRGAVVPVDASDFSGIRFDIRGEGEYFLRVNTPQGRWTSAIEAEGKWRTIKLPFSNLQTSNKTKSLPNQTLLSVEFGGSREPAAALWMELDNVQFY